MEAENIEDLGLKCRIPPVFDGGRLKRLHDCLYSISRYHPNVFL
jgi:hypothetical protein